MPPPFAAPAKASKLAIAVDRAIAAYRAGRFTEAEEICEKVVAKKSNFFDGLHVLGVVQTALGKNEQALRSLNRALALQPRHHDALTNRGNALQHLGRLEEALASYDQALAVKPNAPIALNSRGGTLHKLGRLDAALADVTQAVTLAPQYAEAHCIRGNVLNDLARFDEALTSFNRALAIRTFAEALAGRANTLRTVGRPEEALTDVDKALALTPDHIDTLDLRGIILGQMRRFDEALALYDRILALQPANVSAHNNRANILRDMGRRDEALSGYERAIALQPTFIAALNNRAMILGSQGRYDEALQGTEQVLALDPDYAEAHWNRAAALLVKGDFRNGWRHFEWRWKKAELLVGQRSLSQPLWTGQQDLAGKTILLHAEQGLGDTLQFCRYVPLVAARGANVILEVQPPLKRLISTLTGWSQLVGRGEPLPHFDLQCPLLSLPLAFDTQVDTVPAQTPYLHASAEARAAWTTRLGLRGRPKVGLVWAGNPSHTRDRERSMRFDDIVPLLDIDASFVSLQKDVRSDDLAALTACPDVLTVADDLRDFADTAALVSELDLVISVDTSVAHLAGALGKPVWIMVTHVPEWRWMLDRSDSPWYPTARIFRQDETCTWASAVMRVRDALRELPQHRPLAAACPA